MKKFREIAFLGVIGAIIAALALVATGQSINTISADRFIGGTFNGTINTLTFNPVSANAITFENASGILSADGANLQYSSTSKTLTVPNEIITGATSNAAASSGQFFIRGGQLGFPATQIPSTDPNTLDDYKEGTWNPQYQLGTPGTETFTYFNTGGTYVKIGRIVHLQGWIQATYTAGTGAGFVKIINLPYPAMTDTSGRNGSSSFAVARSEQWTNDPCCLLIEGGQQFIEIFYRTTANGDTGQAANNSLSATVGGNVLVFGGTYISQN